MVRKKIVLSQNGMRNTAVADYYPVLEQTTKDKNEEELSKNEEKIEFSDGINTNDNNDSNARINRTEEATKTSKAYTEPAEEKDKGEDEGADKKTEKNQGTNKKRGEGKIIYTIILITVNVTGPRN